MEIFAEFVMANIAAVFRFDLNSLPKGSGRQIVCNSLKNENIL
jgi:hypothetical protein